MRKLFFLTTVLALLALAVIPSFAQGGSTIVDIAASNPDFSTLVAAVQAAGLAETLAGDGPFTVFAPTNAAFAALPLGTVENLLSDIPTLTALLQYHVLSGSLLQNGFVFAQDRATLEGSPITITQKDGEFFINDSVKIVTSNIGASNGVIHVIDAVLVPSSGDLADKVAAASQVKVRVAHFSPDTPAVDVYVNGQAAIRGLEFPIATGWMTLPGGVYNVAVAPAGTSISQAAIGPVDLELAGGQWLTVAAVGSLANGTLKPQILVEDYSPIPAGSARVSVFHAIEGVEPVDILAGGTPVIRTLAFPGTRGDNDGMDTLTVPGNVYDLQVVPFQRGGPVILDLSNTLLVPGVNYFVAAVGTPDDPQVKVLATDPATGKSPETPTIGTLVPGLADLSTLNALGSSGGAFFGGGVTMLNQVGPFTLFAPTNDAFVKLRSAIGLGAFNAIADNPNSAGTRYILLYHIVPGKLMAADVAGSTTLTSASGEEITVTVRDGRVFLNDTIEVTVTDIEVANGVIHLIDGVLVPPSE